MRHCIIKLRDNKLPSRARYIRGIFDKYVIITPNVQHTRMFEELFYNLIDYTLQRHGIGINRTNVGNMQITVECMWTILINNM